MPLTVIDKQNLQTFIDRHDRYGYWNYLSLKGDPYAKLALGVVTNETLEGYIANQYAAGRAADLGKTLTDQQWWDIGEGIMKADFAARYGSSDTGLLQLGAEVIAKYHEAVFKAGGLDKWAWTTQIPLNDALLKGDLAGAQAIWERMLDNNVWYGMANDPLIAFGLVNDSGLSAIQATTWVGNVVGSTVTYALTSHTSLRDPNHINGYTFDTKAGKWYIVVNPPQGITTLIPADAAAVQKLNEQRNFRLQKFGTNILRTSELSINTLDPVNSVAHQMIMQAGAYHDIAASEPVVADGETALYNQTLLDKVKAQLDGKDLADALIYKDELGVWIEFSDGSNVALDRTGQISAFSKQTYSDNSISWDRLNPDGTRTVGYSYDAGQGMVVVNLDALGNEISRVQISYDSAGNVIAWDGTTSDGSTTNYQFDSNASNGPLPDSGVQTLLNGVEKYGPSVLDALSLIKAIQSGEPLPVLVSGLRLANDLSTLNGASNLNLSGAANAASGVLSLLSLDAALERGDTLGAVTAGAQAIAFGAQAFADFAFESVFNGSVELLDAAWAAQGVADAVGEVLPYLSIVNSIVQGDPVGIAVSVMSAMGVPVIGWAYAVYSIIDSLFGGDEIPDPWGTGSFTWNGTGVSYQSAGETGGNEAVANVMDSVLATMNALIERERQQNPGSQLGLIPQRMPGVGYDMSGYRYTDIDPLTGAEQHPSLRFDTSGNPYNADPGSPESFQSIIEGMVYSAVSRQAIAPLWEVLTARAQTDAGDPKAGLTEEERAGRDGQLAAPITGATQSFRPVVLDMDGDGIETVNKSTSGVAFDVDDSGYLKQTGWLKTSPHPNPLPGGEGANAGPTPINDAFLTLDRDYNGETDSGREMFSNSVVDISRRGVAGMAWVDVNYDGYAVSNELVYFSERIAA